MKDFCHYLHPNFLSDLVFVGFGCASVFTDVFNNGWLDKPVTEDL